MVSRRTQPSAVGRRERLLATKPPRRTQQRLAIYTVVATEARRLGDAGQRAASGGCGVVSSPNITAGAGRHGAVLGHATTRQHVDRTAIKVKCTSKAVESCGARQTVVCLRRALANADAETNTQKTTRGAQASRRSGGTHETSTNLPAGHRNRKPSAQYDPAGQSFSLVRVSLLATVSGVEWNPARTENGADDPWGQNRFGAPQGLPNGLMVPASQK